jgi:hypothetical protein
MMHGEEISSCAYAHKQKHNTKSQGSPVAAALRSARRGTVTLAGAYAMLAVASSRQQHAGAQPALGTIGQRDRTAMRLDDRQRDRQAEPGPAGLPAA